MIARRVAAVRAATVITARDLRGGLHSTMLARHVESAVTSTLPPGKRDASPRGPQGRTGDAVAAPAGQLSVRYIRSTS
jgi:hypothetical protein